MKKIVLILIVVFQLPSIAQAQTTEFWGVTYEGGTNNLGTIFKTDRNGENLEVVISLEESLGKLPKYSLTLASNGRLYGVMAGGELEKGILFEVNPASGQTVGLIDFDGINTGSFSAGPLLEAENGKLYGLTRQGGIHGKGVLFEFDRQSGILEKKVDFDGVLNGSYPRSGLSETSKGKLIGTTQFGGNSDDGVIFEFDPSTNRFTKKLDFNFADGSSPVGSMVRASNDKFYGLNSWGGLHSMGALFEYDASTYEYSPKVDFFWETKGSYPEGSLIQGTNGKLYGMTYHGGALDMGVIFEFEIETGQFEVKMEFNGSEKGKYPDGSLMQASNGNLYGVTNRGGLQDLGVLFEYDYVNNEYVKKLDFDGSNGAIPYYSQLIEIESLVNSVEENLFGDQPLIYPNPSEGLVHIELEGKTKSNIRVLSQDGKLVYKKEDVSGGIYQFDFDQPPGLYIVEVTSMGAVMKYSLVKK